MGREKTRRVGGSKKRFCQIWCVVGRCFTGTLASYTASGRGRFTVAKGETPGPIVRDPPAGLFR